MKDLDARAAKLYQPRPKQWMKPGDVCEVEIERVGLLRNRVEDEAKPN